MLGLSGVGPSTLLSLYEGLPPEKRLDCEEGDPADLKSAATKIVSKFRRRKRLTTEM
jgi:hypothetical protein